MEIKKDTLGDRVKGFEKEQAGVKLDDNLPICVRIDGKSFHTYTKGLARPFDERLSKAMIETTNYLVEKTQAKLGYTQSDEISLVYFKTDELQESFYVGKVQKLNSILASMATARFNQIVNETIPEKNDELAFFDCRVWNVPTLQDAAEVFVWRQEDAIKNAISMAAHAHLSHNAVQGKHSQQKIEMLLEKGVVFDDYPEFFKMGTYSRTKLIECVMPKEMKLLKGNQGKEMYLRSEVSNFYYPRLKQVEDLETFLFQEEFKKAQIKKSKKKTM